MVNYAMGVLFAEMVASKLTLVVALRFSVRVAADQGASVDAEIAWSADRDAGLPDSSARAGRSRQCQSKWADPRVSALERRR
jgi:hypothetical protein